MDAPPLLASRDFRRLWLAQAVSLFGDWFTYVAVGTLALSESTGLIGVAVVLVAHTLPRALLAPFAGVLTDRLDRRLMLIGGSLLRCLVVLAMIVAAGSDDPNATTALAVLLFVRMALSAFTEPAASAALPQLVPAARLGAANALLGATWSALFGLGVAAGGLVTALVGPRGALAIDAVTFVLAAAVFAALPPLRPGERTITASDSSSAPRTHDLLGAWRLARNNASLLHSTLAKLPIAVANGGGWVFLHALAAEQRLGEVAMALGVFHGARAVGTGIGPLIWARIPRLRGTTAGLHLGTALCLGAVAMFSAAVTPTLLIVASVLWGAGMGATWVTSTTRIQQLTPNHALGRISAIDLMIHTFNQCLGGLAAALVADALGFSAAAGWFGFGLAALAWAIITLWVRAVRS